MHQPPGFVQEGKESQVCLLKRSLYGLKQSPQQWYKCFDNFMLKCDFQRSIYDSCVYIKTISKEVSVYLLLYVDDMIITSQQASQIKIVKSLLNKEFEMTDLGSLSKILGMEVRRDRSKQTLFLNQHEYLRKVVKRFKMEQAKPTKIPLAQHFKLSREQSPQNNLETLGI